MSTKPGEPQIKPSGSSEAPSTGLRATERNFTETTAAPQTTQSHLSRQTVWMTPLVLSTVLAAVAAGPPMVPPVSGALQDGGTPARAPDAGTTRTDDRRPRIPSVQPPRDGVVRVNAVDEAPEPSLRISVQGPASYDSGTPRKEARADRADGQTDAYMAALLEQSRAQTEALLEQSRAHTEALLEQSRAQTEALQQIAAQQRASEAASIAERDAQTQRAGQLNGARIAIDGALQSLQAMGDWNADSLESTRASLRQTAAAAWEAGSAVEGSRAAEAARLVEAAQTALAQRNAQQAQYYLLEANQLLFGAPNVRY